MVGIIEAWCVHKGDNPSVQLKVMLLCPFGAYN
jgi:hypothetical protein